MPLTHTHEMMQIEMSGVVVGDVSVELFLFQSQSMDKSFIFSLENNMMTANPTTDGEIRSIRWRNE